MDIYPGITDNTPTELVSSFRNLVTELESGLEHRRNVQVQPKRSMRLAYNALLETERNQLWNFYQKMKGAYGEFIFRFPASNLTGEEWENEYIGKGDASKTDWRLPIYSYTTLSVYLDEILQTITEDYTIGADGDGFKHVVFVTAPALDEVITISFEGVPQIYARFEEDQLSRTQFTALLTSYGIGIRELKKLNV